MVSVVVALARLRYQCLLALDPRGDGGGWFDRGFGHAVDTLKLPLARRDLDREVAGEAIGCFKMKPNRPACIAADAEDEFAFAADTQVPDGKRGVASGFAAEHRQFAARWHSPAHDAALGYLPGNGGRGKPCAIHGSVQVSCGQSGERKGGAGQAREEAV